MKAGISFDRLDTRLFRAFQAAAETLNFTHAAKVASMTQSGISQQVSKLEEQIGSPLFKRLPKSIQLTPAGKSLLRFIDSFNDQVSDLLENISTEQVSLNGRVTYAMPNSCLASPHLLMLLQKRAFEAQNLILDISIIPNHKIFHKLLNGEIDFGFVTEKNTHPQITSQLFCDEEYVLVGNAPFPAKLTAEMILQGNFVAFPGMDIYFNAWADAYFPGEKSLTYENLRIMGNITTLEGALKLMEGGVGWGILPLHAIQSDSKKNNFYIYRKDKKVVTNSIFIVTLKDLKMPKRVQCVLNWFHSMVSN